MNLDDIYNWILSHQNNYPGKHQESQPRTVPSYKPLEPKAQFHIVIKVTAEYTDNQFLIIFLFYLKISILIQVFYVKFDITTSKRKCLMEMVLIQKNLEHLQWKLSQITLNHYNILVLK
ncbi:unnamed protein product [Paramecium sonneborni]|uniref:Uncharacterized protein n=1 Tax=Paramecium sonneborni TaxID=65129 RepID=A0A8S1QT89_9CILI|nr:unnamed protein product [Paramecium sonneborni]